MSGGSVAANRSTGDAKVLASPDSPKGFTPAVPSKPNALFAQLVSRLQPIIHRSHLQRILIA